MQASIYVCILHFLAEDIEKYVEETSDVPAKNDAIMKSTSKQTAAVTDTTPTN